MFEILNFINNTYCSECDGNCIDDCNIKQLKEMLLSYKSEEELANFEGCHICKTKKGSKSVLYDDGRGGFRESIYCPNCGRKLN